MCSLLRDKRRVRERCVALLVSVLGKRRCGAQCEPQVGQLPWGLVQISTASVSQVPRWPSLRISPPSFSNKYGLYGPRPGEEEAMGLSHLENGRW